MYFVVFTTYSVVFTTYFGVFTTYFDVLTTYFVVFITYFDVYSGVFKVTHGFVVRRFENLIDMLKWIKVYSIKSTLTESVCCYFIDLKS